MTFGATVGGNERLRLFYGLPLPADAALAIRAWQESVLAGNRDVRAVESSMLHVTLAFLGSRPRSELATLCATLREAAAATRRPELVVQRYRETDRVGMLVLEDRGGHAAELQARLVGRLRVLGLAPVEERRWLPHVTVARFRRRPRLSPGLPEPGRMSPSEAALYHSLLRPSGAQYEFVEAAPLGG